MFLQINSALWGLIMFTLETQLQVVKIQFYKVALQGLIICCFISTSIDEKQFFYYICSAKCLYLINFFS